MSPIRQPFLHPIRPSQRFSRKRVLRVESLEQRMLLDAASLYSLSATASKTYDSDLEINIAAEATSVSNLASQSFSLLSNASEAPTDEYQVSVVGDYYTIDFALDGTQRAYLTGLTANQLADIAEEISTFQTEVFYDAEKTDVGDTDLCWAATSSNMLRYTGWGLVNGLKTEDDILTYFTNHFTDDGSTIEAGNEWFLTGVYAPKDEGFDDDDDDDGALLTQAGGAFWPGAHWNEVGGAYSASTGHTDTDEEGKTAEKMDFSFDMEVLTMLTGHLQKGDAVGLGVYWTNLTTMESEGGHAITMWGYAYDTAYTTYDPEYYTMLFISDSDDANPAAGGVGGAEAPNQLRRYAISWDSEEASYYFTTYGYENGTAGYLADGTWLVQRSAAALTPSGGLKVPRDGYSIRENSRENAFVGKLRPVNTVSKDDVYTYELTAGSDYFQVDNNGVLRVKKDAVLDYEKIPSVQVTILTSLNGELQYADTFAVEIVNQNEKPSDIGCLVTEKSEESGEFVSKVVTAVNVAEREATVGQLTARDPEGTPCTFRLSGPDAKLFTIVENGGKYLIQTKTILSFETPQDKNHDGTYDLIVTATDTAGKSASQKIQVKIIHQEIESSLTLDMPAGQNNTWTVEMSNNRLTVQSGTKTLVDEVISNFDPDLDTFALTINGQAGNDTLIWKCAADLQSTADLSARFNLLFNGGMGMNTVHVDGANTGNRQTLMGSSVRVGDTALEILLAENTSLLSQLYLDGGTGNDWYELRSLSCVTVIRDRGGTDTIDLTHTSQGVTLDLNKRTPQPMFGTTLTLRSKIETAIAPSE